MTSDNWVTYLLATILILITLLYFYLTRNFNYWKNRNIQYFQPSFPFGAFKDVLLQRISIGDFLADLHARTEGPYSGLYAFSSPCLLLKDPKVIKTVLVSEFSSFSDRGMATNFKGDPIGSYNLFMMKTTEWRKMRQKLSPLFTLGKLKQMFALINETGDRLVQNLKSSKTSLMPVKDVAMRYTTEVITTCAFGIQSKGLEDDKDLFFQAGKRILDFSYSRAIQMASFFFAPDGLVRSLRFQFFHPESVSFLRKIFTETMYHRESTGLQRNDMMEALMEIKKNDSTLENDQLVAQSAVFLIAGFETSSSLISFTLHHLTHQPELQARLRNEIQTTLSNTSGELTYEVVNNMEYLHMVVSETLRMYPPLAFLTRQCTKQYTFPDTGFTIEKGTKLFISLLGLHKDPKYFPNPEVFDPERFSQENKKNIIPGTYIPFGLGPHNCIGERFGYLSSKIGLIRVLSEFEVLKCDKSTIEVKMDPKSFLITPLNNLPMIIRKLPIPAA